MTPHTSGITVFRLSFAAVLSAVLLVASGASASVANAQASPPKPGSRPALEMELRIQDSLAASGVASARARADHLRQRLSEGVFRVGYHVVILIQNSEDYPVNIVEPFADTLIVSEARTLTVPQAGVLRLAGILRPELDSMLNAALSRVFVTQPQIITTVTIPITV